MDRVKKMELAGLDVLWQGESALGGCKGGSRRIQMQLTGSK
jgi:hypothetical protein